MIVGKQPPIPVLGANESQYRFNRIFKEFVRVFATHEHPLVIFLDDLQWADVASLNLINSIVTDISIQYLLVIGAYRDNEVNPAHPFMLTIDDIRSHNGTINTIILKNLELTDVNALLSETFNCSPEKSLSLAELCISKTDANPFFLTQLLTTNSITTNCGNSDFLDLASVIKASQTLASEIVKDKFLDKLIKIVIENTGADKFSIG